MRGADAHSSPPGRAVGGYVIAPVIPHLVGTGAYIAGNATTALICYIPFFMQVASFDSRCRNEEALMLFVAANWTLDQVSPAQQRNLQASTSDGGRRADQTAGQSRLNEAEW
jgi:hypothetical protein